MRPIALLLSVGLLLAGASCSDEGDDQGAQDESTTTTEAEQVTIHLRIETSSGLVAQNLDDEMCRFGDGGRYEVRDGGGEVLTAGSWTPLADVEATFPNYACSKEFDVGVEAAEFYELTLSHPGSGTEDTITISANELDDQFVLTIDG